MGIAKGNGVGLTRHLEGGSLDPGFDGDGMAFANTGSGGAAPSDADLLPGGAIAVGGIAYPPPTFDAMAMRFTPAGALDPGFGNDPPNPAADGVSVFDLGAQDQVLGVAADGEGRLLLAGRTGSNLFGGPNDIFVRRLRPDGSPDPSFGGGLVQLSPGTDARGFDVAVGQDGAILVTATIDGQVSVLRFTAAGALDPGFGGGDGIATVAALSSASAESVPIAPDGRGRIVLATLVDGPPQAWGVARLLADGVLDTSFSADGVHTQTVGSSGYLADVAVADDDRALVGGMAWSGADMQAAVLRLTPGGEPDAGFGGDGVVEVGSPTTDEFGLAIAVQPDRRILLGGDVGVVASFADRFLTRLVGDTHPPGTKITKGPKGTVDGGGRARLRFKAKGDVNTTFQCRLKAPKRGGGHRLAAPKGWRACASPRKVRIGAEGRYAFSVRAADPAGNRDPTPAKRRWRVAG